MLAVKGAGSYHPCAKCKAIRGRLPPSNFGDEYFHHYISADPSLWDQYTIEEFAAACAEVKTAWTESRARGEEVETSLGISRDACLTSPLYRVPVSVYWGIASGPQGVSVSTRLTSGSARSGGTASPGTLCKASSCR